MSQAENIRIPTPHIQAGDNEFAETVLMPGDPLRAKFIAETFLKNIKQINSIRGMLAFTGKYKGRKVSIMGSGMGMPSIGIYSYELFKFYNVKTIIRVGSCGGYSKKLNVYDVLMVDKAYSESSYAQVQNGNKEEYAYPSRFVNNKIIEIAKETDIKVIAQTVNSSDVFYMEHELAIKHLKKMQKSNIGAVEMESFALFSNANILNKQAACILTVSDSLVTGQETTAEEREIAFTKMMKLSLETAIKL